MSESSSASRPESGTPWWRSAVIYQVYVRSFADSNGDGVGDLAGIRSRLSYVRDLGVDAVWLTPFYPSPLADGGYDVADYRDVHPLLGSLEDFDALVTEAHRLGLRVVVDLVPNHTSDEHPWFQAALAAGPGSRERARYVFRPGRGGDGALPPNDWLSVFGGDAWTRVPDGEWYLHLFDVKQPDLDWLNPDVRADFLDILRFWLDRGVDGFRVDVAHGLAKDPALPDLLERRTEIMDASKRVNHPHWDRDEVHEVYREWRKVLDAYDGDRMAVGEAWVATPERLARYLRPDELHSAFNFDFLKSPWDAGRLREVIDGSVEALGAVGAPPTWVLSSHDSVRPVTRYGRGEVGRRRARAAALLMLGLPGGAYVYQGEELGLFEVEDLPEDVLEDPTWERSGRTRRGRDGCRVPIPWTRSGPSHGFGPDGSWLPQPPEWGELSVEAQRDRDGSFLSLYRSALALRRTEPGLGEGTLRWLDSPERTLVFARDPDVVVAVNLGDEPLSLPSYGALLLGSDGSVSNGVLPPDTAAWYRPA